MYAYWIQHVSYRRTKGVPNALSTIGDVAHKAIIGPCSDFCSLFQDRVIREFRRCFSTRNGIHAMLVYGILQNFTFRRTDYCLDIVYGAEKGNLRLKLTWEEKGENVTFFQLRNVIDEKDLSGSMGLSAKSTPSDLGCPIPNATRECRIYCISFWKTKCSIRHFTWLRGSSGIWKRLRIRS